MKLVKSRDVIAKLSDITGLVEVLKTVDTKSNQAKLNKESFSDNNGRRISYSLRLNKSKHPLRK